MWTVRQIINAELELKAGETRIEDGQLAMCITPNASYGGGGGSLWAVENQCVQFSTDAHAGYLQGICRKVDPQCRSITLEITQGPTWGTMAMGQTVTLPITAIRRYHPAPQAGQALVFQSQALRSRILADQAFIDISQRELQQALASEHGAVLARLVGLEVHEALREVAKQYLSLCKQVDASDGACALMPSTAMNRTRRALRGAIARLAAQVPQEAQT